MYLQSITSSAGFQFAGGGFAISGAVTGIEKKLDLFGITFLAIITGVGGMIRDIFVGNVPFVQKREIYAMALITWHASGKPAPIKKHLKSHR